MDTEAGTDAIRKELHHMADSLREGATWDDVMDEVYVQIVIDEGLKAGKDGPLFTTGEIRKELGLLR